MLQLLFAFIMDNITSMTTIIMPIYSCYTYSYAFTVQCRVMRADASARGYACVCFLVLFLSVCPCARVVVCFYVCVCVCMRARERVPPVPLYLLFSPRVYHSFVNFLNVSLQHSPITTNGRLIDFYCNHLRESAIADITEQLHVDITKCIYFIRI